MARIAYSQHARDCLVLHGEASANSLDDFIAAAGFKPAKAMSISTLNKLLGSGEVTKCAVFNAKTGRRSLLFTATPLLGRVDKKGRDTGYANAADGVLMLQAILGNMAARRTLTPTLSHRARE